MTHKLRQVLLTLVALAALALGRAALAGAASGGGGSDPSTAITGDAKPRAGTAALAATGGGKIGQTELDEENGATYEVEVARTDGSQIDVRLDDAFKVVVIEADGEPAGDSGR
jgi:uncharacterized membrane protein YkoI